MLSWKEKVADKLSRLLADSPASSSSAASPLASGAGGRSPFVRPDPQELISPEEKTSPKKSSLSSYLFSYLPRTSYSTDGNQSTSATQLDSIRPLPLHSLPGRLKINGFEECGTESESDEIFETPKERMDPTSERNFNNSNETEETSTSHDYAEFLSYLSDKSAFISAGLFEFLQSCLPNIVKGCQWVLLYSTWKHGISLRTLLRNSVHLPGPCLLIVGDTQGVVFGGLLDSPLKPTAKRKYQGTNQTFVFTTLYGEPRLFRATGANRYYYLCLNDVLAFGGGGSFALSLDEDLLRGTSGPCETFGNLCLAHSPDFELKNVELWGFAHSSRYLA